MRGRGYGGIYTRKGVRDSRKEERGKGRGEERDSSNSHLSRAIKVGAEEKIFSSYLQTLRMDRTLVNNKILNHALKYSYKSVTMNYLVVLPSFQNFGRICSFGSTKNELFFM